MSYILDALRKAEAERERERGQVPSLHTQQPVPGVLPPGAPRAGSMRWVWLGAGAVLVVALGAGLAWWWLRGGTPSASAPAVATVAPAAPAAVPVTTTPPLPATAPAPVAQAPVARKPKPTSAAAEPNRAPAGATLPAATPSPAQAPVVGAARAPGAANAAGPIPGKIYALSELPDDIRSQLPKLTVGGSMYSPVRENRVLIVNGQVAKEGATIAPNVVLEQVRVRSAILQFRGYRYSLPF